SGKVVVSNFNAIVTAVDHGVAFDQKGEGMVGIHRFIGRSLEVVVPHNSAGLFETHGVRPVVNEPVIGHIGGRKGDDTLVPVVNCQRRDGCSSGVGRDGDHRL